MFNIVQHTLSNYIIFQNEGEYHMKKYPVWGYRPLKTDLKHRADIEAIHGKMTITEYLRFCQNFAWRNCLVGLQQQEELKHEEWMEARKRLDEAKRIEKIVRDRLFRCDVNEASEELAHIFRIITKFEELDATHSFPQNRRFKEAQIPALKEDIPMLKDLSHARCMTMIEDRSIIKYYLTQKVLSQSELIQ